MCGIVGGVSERNVVPIILNGLDKMEYRGYDSVGIAILNQKMILERERVTGRVKALTDSCKKLKLYGNIGIGHTRWATHGQVNVDNAHPHVSCNKIAVVHNGIIENYVELKQMLIENNYIFSSETDSEVIAHLIHYYLSKIDCTQKYKMTVAVAHQSSPNGQEQELAKSEPLLIALSYACKDLKGAYAIAVMDTNSPNSIICAMFGAPLLLGVGIDEVFCASDVMALLPITNRVVYLQDGDIALLHKEGFQVYNCDQSKKEDNISINLISVKREIMTSDLSLSDVALNGFRHYMQKEIYEQPQILNNTLYALGSSFAPEVFGDINGNILSTIKRVQIIACGTSFHAGLVAKYWFEQIANISCEVDIASEYRYRSIVADADTLVLSISQSGETADTLACLKHAISLGMDKTLAICNVPESSLVRLSKFHILTKAGSGVGVASTKAFTSQLIVLLYLAVTLGKVRGACLKEEIEGIREEMKKIPALIDQIFDNQDKLELIAKSLKDKSHALFLGRSALYPIALEGALKIKEISYLHAEGYPAGELKHGPLALIDNSMPVICLLSTMINADKMQSNIEEVLARSGKVILISDAASNLDQKCLHVFNLPKFESKYGRYIQPILYTVPLQLLAYYVAVLKGTDVDKPRNLAKSVTVE